MVRTRGADADTERRKGATMTAITAVRAVRVAGRGDTPANEERQVGMLDIYPRYGDRAGGSTGGVRRIEAIYIEIETDEGVTGRFGPVFAETAAIIQIKLAAHLIGQDALAGEYLWDILYRSDRHARTGNQMMAISALDNALWDVRGKLWNKPVYRLLGGPTRGRIPAYASMLGHSLEPGRVGQRVREMTAMGFRAQKWFFRHGPADGPEGMERNAALARTVRDAAGPDVELMFDCWMGWDATYAIRMLHSIADVRPRWLEEPVPADRVGDLALIRREGRTPIATGEHEYTRWGFLRLLQAEAVDVIQADPDWCGGISELVKIVALASAYGRQVVPHGHSVAAAVHVIAASSPAVCPMAEYLVRAVPAKQWFHTHPLVPEGGSFALPDVPGLGLDLDDAKIEERSELWSVRG